MSSQQHMKVLMKMLVLICFSSIIVITGEPYISKSYPAERKIAPSPAGNENISEPSWFNRKFHYLVNGTIFKGFYRSFVDEMKLRGDESALDFGSGTGAEAVHIAEVLSRGTGRVTCLDISSRWLDTAKQRLKKYDNADFLLGDITEMSIDEGSFDVVVIHFVLHDISRDSRPRIVGPLARSLKKGGKLFIREPLNKNHGIPAEEIRVLMEGSGLKESGFKFSKSFFMGPMFEAAFTK